METKRIKLKRPNQVGYNGLKPFKIPDILAYLPEEDCFFDTYHWVVGIGIIPFPITTRINCDDTKWLKIYDDGFIANKTGNQ